MALNCLRHRARGYRSARPALPKNAAAALRYDCEVADNWLEHLYHYTGNTQALRGGRVLELAPGSDLGTGLLLLSRGAASYSAVDKNPLLGREPEAAHQRFLQAMEERFDLQPLQIDRLRQIIANQFGESDGPLAYRCLPSFDLSILPEKSIDLLFSHSTLEHLDCVRQSLEQLTRVAAPGCILVAQIDLQTHTRWIRDVDPLNIYRYQPGLYKALSFSGSPNRLRPPDYAVILESTGWTNPHLYPRRVLDTEYVRQVEDTLAPGFRGEGLGWLTLVVCATRVDDLASSR